MLFRALLWCFLRGTAIRVQIRSSRAGGDKENMRHHCRKLSSMRTAHGQRTTPAWLSLLGGVSALAMTLAAPAHAQQGEFVVDVSDPSISIDLSVLDDGGHAPQLGAQMPSGQVPSTSRRGGSQAPGPQAPVSTLYIQPSGTFALPPQTKVLIAEPTPEVMPEAAPADVAEAPAPVAPAPVTPAPVIAEPEAVAEITPVVPAPEVAAPAVPEAPVEPAAPAAQDVAKAEPEPVAAPEPVPVVTPEPAPEPIAEPVQAEPATQQTPPPPPQALTQDTPAPVAAEPEAAPQTAPQTPSSSVQVALPPKLAETQPGVASLPSPTGPLADGDSMRIVFEHDSSKLPSTARDALKALSDRMGQQESLRLQLLAYAGDTDTSASAARRLSLSRALAVRSYLIENGVRSTRIDVRALGNKSTEEVTERVDITVVER